MSIAELVLFWTTIAVILIFVVTVLCALAASYLADMYFTKVRLSRHKFSRQAGASPSCVVGRA